MHHFTATCTRLLSTLPAGRDACRPLTRRRRIAGEMRLDGHLRTHLAHEHWTAVQIKDQVTAAKKNRLRLGTLSLVTAAPSRKRPQLVIPSSECHGQLSSCRSNLDLRACNGHHLLYTNKWALYYSRFICAMQLALITDTTTTTTTTTTTDAGWTLHRKCLLLLTALPSSRRRFSISFAVDHVLRSPASSPRPLAR